MQTADVGPVTDALAAALDAAEPWFTDPTLAAAGANADVVATGFVVARDGVFYRASYLAARDAVAGYAHLTPRAPFATVTAMCTALAMMANRIRDPAAGHHRVPVILRKAGCLHDSRSADRGPSPRSWSFFTDLEFYAHDCDVDVEVSSRRAPARAAHQLAPPPQILVYMVDQWTFGDLRALIAHLAPRTPRITLLGTGRFNNRAGYNVLPKLYPDFTLADVAVDPRAADASGAFNLRPRTNYAWASATLDTNTLAWLHDFRTCYRSRWVFVCEEPELVASLRLILANLHGPERGPPAANGGPRHAVVPVVVKGGAADGVVGVLAKVTGTVQSRTGKRPRTATVKAAAFGLGAPAPGATRTALLGNPTNPDAKIAPVALGPGVALVPKRICTLDECAGLNGCSFVYISSAPAPARVWQSLMCVRGSRIVNVIRSAEAAVVRHPLAA